MCLIYRLSLEGSTGACESSAQEATGLRVKCEKRLTLHCMPFVLLEIF